MSQRAPELPPPWQIHSTEDYEKKFNLRYATYAKSENPAKWVVFLNGRSEWIEKYHDLPESIRLDTDWGFLTLDHRGQGLSGGSRSWVATYDHYIFDVQKVIEEVVGSKAYMMIAHSMGGLVSLYGTLRGILKPEALALSAPLFRLPNNPVPRALAKPTSGLLAKVGLGKVGSGAGNFDKTRFERNQLTHDFNRYIMTQKTPFKVPSASFGWVSATFEATDFIFAEEQLKNLHAPTLVLSGSEEEVVDPAGHGDWVRSAAEASKTDVTLQIIHGARHELLAESPEFRDPALDHIRGWMDRFF